MVQASPLWCSPWVMLASLGSPLVIPALFLLGKRVTITYGLIPGLRRTYRLWRIGKIALGVVGACISTLAGVAVACILAFYPSTVRRLGMAPLMIVFVVGFGMGLGGAFASIFLGNPPLIPTKYRQGMFWVKGCSEEFLARIEAEKKEG